MARIVLEGVKKVFDRTVVAVDDVSLEIPDGEIVSLLGPSGCGKTTTMRLIAGFEDADEGRIFIDDKDVTTWPPQKRNLSMVFQFPVVYDTMTIYDNIAAPLHALKYRKEKIREVVEDAIAKFEIDSSLLRKKASNLSISDRQRVSLAHALAIERNAYILDEPFSNIDPKSRVKLTKYVRDTQRKMGNTLIFVTHSQSEALTLSDKIAVMKDGKILQYGSPEEIYSRPASTFVGWFLGNPGMNFIECSLAEKEGRLLLDAGSFTAHENLPPRYEGKLSGREKVTLGIRPEDVAISKEGKSHYIPCVCHFVEQVGSRLLLNVELGKEVMINIKVPMDVDVDLGDRLYVYFPEEKIMLFDVASGEALV